MKKIFIGTFALALTAFAFQGCKPVDNTKAWASADSMAKAKLMVLRDSLNMACMTNVMTAAMAKADSTMAAAMAKAGKKYVPSKPAAAPAAPAKPSGLKGLSDQAKQQGSGGIKSLSDQKKAADTTKKKGLKGLSDQAKQPK